MLRYVLVVVLVNLYGRGLGIPVNQDNGKIYLVEDLTGLANSCEVPFIKSEIEDHLSECNYTVSGYEHENASALPCFMYYDMNSRLCNALKLSGITQITEDNKAKLRGNMVLDNVCNLAKEWTVGELQKYPPYKLAMEKIFKSNLTSHCIRFCGVSDALSDHVNYFCSYVKWGQDFIASLKSEKKPSEMKPSVDTPINPTSNQDSKPEQDNVAKTVETTNISSGPGQLNNNIAPINPNLFPSQEFQDIEVKTPLKKLEIHEKPKPSVTKTSQEVILDEQVVKTDPNQQNTELKDNIEDTNVEVDKPFLLDPTAKHIEVEKVTEKQLIEPPKDISNDFGGTGLDGDGDNYNGNMDDYEGSRQETSDKKTPSKTISTPSTKLEDKTVKVTNLGYVRDSTIAELEDNNDHFFTVFLTGVMLVVFVYVLYHNKSKVTKVVLGLIVEGRHNSRRRNSRGHAYRRLDTLEQAMSSDSTAPPTKIIY